MPDKDEDMDVEERSVPAFDPAIEGVISILMDRGFDEHRVRELMAESQDEVYNAWLGPAADYLEEQLQDEE